MSTISGLGGSSSASAWAAMSATRKEAAGPPNGTDFADHMLTKFDSDSSGTVDQTELQSMLDDIAKHTGTSNSSSSSSSAADVMKKLDSNGDGTLDKTELETGLKSLMPAPSSTVSFAQTHGGAQAGGTPPGPPPGPPPEGASGGDSSNSTSTSSTSSTSATSSSSAYDPLDTNQDGTVSAQERAAGAAAQAIKDLMKAADTDGDGKVSSSEMTHLKQALSSIASGSSGNASTGNGADTGTGASSATTAEQQAALKLEKLVQGILQKYAAATDAGASQTNASTQSLNVTA
ncbi:EF-hand domain-containing protein [Roseateles koreensis]|uniref:EF-hand domain-containing protein n=1 Tax=Roseateles koreensis TaxID=2987526 RepID=A0ABT5KSJ7_9BURK|nr:EF-hand domain-containing protein [Roseateles koreensis]MDC8785906.1 EF-hand domain-containing protein [Roseateles koreensis]